MLQRAGHDWQIGRDHIGPLRVGQPPEEVRRHLGEPLATHGAEGLDFHEYGDITVTFWEGLVSMVIADDGFPGETAEGIRVGTPLNEAVARVGELSYDSEQSLWTFDGSGRLYLQLGRPALPREDTSVDPPWVEEAYPAHVPESTFVRRIYLI